MKKYALKSVTYGALMALAYIVSISIALAKEQSARLNARVDVGKMYTTRLGNLPKGAKVTIATETDGGVVILLVNKEDMSRFPRFARPLFQGQTSDRLTFSLRIPESGDYFFIVDNRRGADPRNFTFSVTASAEPASAAPEEATAKLAQAYRELDTFEARLREVFVFDELEFRIGRCGTGNAFSGDDTIYICAEIGQRLVKDIDDAGKARDALLFAMLHEIGHVLLEQWAYPFYDNEEVADEFATVLMVMFGQGERARTQAEYFSRQSPDEELARKRNRDDRHPLSVQRARNITGWLDDPGLVKRWQKVLVPHMQTDALRTLELRPKPWVDSALIKKELARRGVE